ncbi:hypothetical protein BJQ90_00509 [Arthrobacter sp. SO3]|nr:hypothetical protein [Arthrobacter sp. SO3]
MYRRKSVASQHPDFRNREEDSRPVLSQSTGRKPAGIC